MSAIPTVVNLRHHLETHQHAPGGLASLAVRANVPRRAVSRILAGQPINADTYLKVCGAVGIDPVTGESCPPSTGFDIQWRIFAIGIRAARILHKLSTRDAASLIRVSSATISRAEAGRPIRVESYLALCAFVGTHPHHYANGFTGNYQCNNLKTIAVVEAAE